MYECWEIAYNCLSLFQSFINHSGVPEGELQTNSQLKEVIMASEAAAVQPGRPSASAWQRLSAFSTNMWEGWVVEPVEIHVTERVRDFSTFDEGDSGLVRVGKVFGKALALIASVFAYAAAGVKWGWKTTCNVAHTLNIPGRFIAAINEHTAAIREHTAAIGVQTAAIGVSNVQNEEVRRLAARIDERVPYLRTEESHSPLLSAVVGQSTL